MTSSHPLQPRTQLSRASPVQYSRSSKKSLQRHCCCCCCCPPPPVQRPRLRPATQHLNPFRKCIDETQVDGGGAIAPPKPCNLITLPSITQGWQRVSCHRRTILIPTLEFSPRPDEVRISILLFLLTIACLSHFISILHASSNKHNILHTPSRDLQLSHLNPLRHCLTGREAADSHALGGAVPQEGRLGRRSAPASSRLWHIINRPIY